MRENWSKGLELILRIFGLESDDNEDNRLVQKAFRPPSVFRRNVLDASSNYPSEQLVDPLLDRRIHSTARSIGGRVDRSMVQQLFIVWREHVGDVDRDLEKGNFIIRELGVVVPDVSPWRFSDGETPISSLELLAVLETPHSGSNLFIPKMM